MYVCISVQRDGVQLDALSVKQLIGKPAFGIHSPVGKTEPFANWIVRRWMPDLMLGINYKLLLLPDWNWVWGLFSAGSGAWFFSLLYIRQLENPEVALSGLDRKHHATKSILEMLRIYLQTLCFMEWLCLQWVGLATVSLYWLTQQVRLLPNHDWLTVWSWCGFSDTKKVTVPNYETRDSLFWCGYCLKLLCLGEMRKKEAMPLEEIQLVSHAVWSAVFFRNAEPRGRDRRRSGQIVGFQHRSGVGNFFQSQIRRYWRRLTSDMDATNSNPRVQKKCN